ncbi:CDGSH iron-sulfur domain-containing protein [Streptomyces roseicoloratus]|uniref:CDGSH iron-sulfur domain-containing protein n=1 Tax=Streptomyces roseicoloratus TaxID=2508722 RepID=A0ABY9RNJ9_9ACTN|nr:CDGSH iron-sulfur domain-containing protein [Streptomyces roseicoloratus]WMX43766.1 CDGSH iron-sulfur domain-containing protein [Streptomyces roseicoloratus]
MSAVVNPAERAAAHRAARRAQESPASPGPAAGGPAAPPVGDPAASLAGEQPARPAGEQPARPAGELPARPAAVRVTPVADGPLLVEGPVEIVLADGTVRRSDRPVVALCMCRRSLRAPFCDTSHRRRLRRDRDGTGRRD